MATHTYNEYMYDALHASALPGWRRPRAVKRLKRKTGGISSQVTVKLNITAILFHPWMTSSSNFNDSNDIMYAFLHFEMKTAPFAATAVESKLFKVFIAPTLSIFTSFF